MTLDITTGQVIEHQSYFSQDRQHDAAGWRVVVLTPQYYGMEADKVIWAMTQISYVKMTMCLNLSVEINGGNRKDTHSRDWDEVG